MKHMLTRRIATSLAVIIASTLVAAPLRAATPEEAAQLKSTLTPLGAERAGSADGRIPAWTGGFTGHLDGESTGRRADPFPNEKPLYSVTAANLDKYGDTVSDGQKALLKKYPAYRLDVYPTHRTAAAPQYVYDNTFKNATRGKMVGTIPTDVYGGVPFPIPKSGLEVVWNHLLAWQGESWKSYGSGVNGNASGRPTLAVINQADQQMPYYMRDGEAKFRGDYWLVHVLSVGPPIKVGEAITGRDNLNDAKTQVWVYLAGQRRVRQLPNGCCDTPLSGTDGSITFDEVDVWNGTPDRFDWKIISKKEMLVPYNANRANGAPLMQLAQDHFLNPDLVRWELHRVWIVEATLRPGQRHTSPKSRYYFDEDSWTALLSDRYDASGDLWRTSLLLPGLAPDFPAIVQQSFTTYNLKAGTYYTVNADERYVKMPHYDDNAFTPETLSGESVR